MAVVLTVGIALLIVVLIGVISVRIGKRSGREEVRAEVKSERQRILDDLRGQQLYGFYDPDYAREVGSSVYKTSDGRHVEVTHVSPNPFEFRRRKNVKSVSSVGRVDSFVRRNRVSNDFVTRNGIDLPDPALLMYLYLTMFEDRYAYDESQDNRILPDAPLAPEEVGQILEPRVTDPSPTYELATDPRRLDSPDATMRELEVAAQRADDRETVTAAESSDPVADTSRHTHHHHQYEAPAQTYTPAYESYSRAESSESHGSHNSGHSYSGSTDPSSSSNSYSSDTSSSSGDSGGGGGDGGGGGGGD